LALGLGNLLGYVVGGETPYGWSHSTYMAAHSAAGFMLLGTGLLAFVWSRMTGPEQMKSRSLALESGIGLVVLALILWQSLLAQGRFHLEQNIGRQRTHLARMIEGTIKPQILALTRMARRWENRGGTPEAEWRYDVARHIADQPGFQAIEWVDVTDHVRWVEPLSGNEAALNLDLGFEKRRRQALEKVRQQGEVTVTRTVDLVQGGKGFLIYAPLFDGDRFDGFMLGVFRIRGLLDNILAEVITEGYAIQIFDGNEKIYQRNVATAHTDTVWGQEQDLRFDGINWRLRLWPTTVLLAKLHSLLPVIALTVGLVLALLMGFTVHLFQRSRQQMVKVGRANRELTSAITERQLVEERLRASQRMLETVFDNAPFMIWGTDEKGILKYFNKKSVETMEFSSEEAIGMLNMNLHPLDKRDEVFEKFKVHVGEKLEDKLELPLMTKSGKKLVGSMTQAVYEDEYGKKWYFCFVDDITEHKRIEKALQESELWQRGIFNALAEGVVVMTPDRLILNLNSAGLAMVGYSLQEVINQSVEMFHVDHDHFVEFGKRLETAFDKGEVDCLEFEIKRKNGEVFPTEHIVSMLKDDMGRIVGIVNVVRDITVRKQVEEELRKHRDRLEERVRERTSELWMRNKQLQSEVVERKQSERQLKMQTLRNEIILETTQDGFWMVDLDGKICDVNEACCRMLGYTREQLLEMGVADVEASESPQKANMHIQKIMVQGSDRFETRHRCQDGAFIDLDVSVSLVDFDGERFFFTFFRDIGERKQDQRELENSRRQFRDLAIHLQTVREEERARLARDVHDEIGQVLTALNMDVHWLRERIPEHEEDMRRKILSMLPLIASIITSVQRITSELRPAMLDELGLGPAIQWYLEEFQQRTGIECEWVMELDEAQLDSARATAVFRILQETLTNVARHSGAGRVSLDINKGADHLEMRITDDGRGICPSAASADNAFGLLGMKERALAFGGSVDIEGHPGKGTTVLLRLPLDTRSATP
ncbi:MAG TPA: PAS domain S-box protein, partial [Acidiferrobacteraceae bacterium]|nr:PAS domain S-box protein [Acidiferrobacteraceae bacterium]